MICGALLGATAQLVACGGDDASSSGGDAAAGGDASADGAGQTSQDGTVVEASTDAAPRDGSSSSDGASSDGASSDGASSDGASSDGSSSDGSSSDGSSSDGSFDTSDGGGLSDAAPTSCAELTVPLATESGSTHFIVVLSGSPDLTTATITAEVYAPQATAGVVQAFIQQGSANSYTETFLGWKSLTSTSSWTVLSWTVSGANATAIERVGLSIETGLASDASASFEQPDTIIYVGGISIAGASPSVGTLLFDASSTVGADIPKYPPGELWMNTDDSYVAGSSLVWDPACGTPVENEAGAQDASSDADADAASDSSDDATTEASTGSDSDGGADGTTDATSEDGTTDATSADAACVPGTIGCGWQGGDIVTYSSVVWGDIGSIPDMLNADYDTVYGPTSDSLTVGNPTGFTMTFDSPDAIIAYLPSSGTPGPLTASLLDPVTSASGSLGGEVVALNLNIAFTDLGLVSGSTSILFGDLHVCGLPASTTTSALNGETVRQVLATADLVLSGATSSITPADLFVTLASINSAFNNGAVSTFAQNNLVNGACP